MPRSLERETHGLHMAEAAAAHANGAGDLLGDVETIGREVDVVGDERHPRADDRGAGGRVRRLRPEVGRPLRLRIFAASPSNSPRRMSSRLRVPA